MNAESMDRPQIFFALRMYRQLAKFSAFQSQYADVLNRNRRSGMPVQWQKNEAAIQAIHLMTIRKLYAWELESLFEYVLEHPETCGPSQSDIQQLRIENGQWFLGMNEHITNCSLRIGAIEYINALSIPLKHWDSILSTAQWSYVQLVTRLADPVVKRQVNIARDHKDIAPISALDVAHKVLLAFEQAEVAM